MRLRSIDDYADSNREDGRGLEQHERQAGGDPAKLAVHWSSWQRLDEPPARFAAGADAVQAFEAKAGILLAQAGAHRALCRR